MKEIVFASNNKGKIRELQEILNDYKILSLEEMGIDIDVEEDKDTSEGNAIKKAVEISKYLKEKAVLADFCNPLYANAKITTKTEWEKYRYLFQMHLNLKLIEQHLRLGRIYDKKVAYFYDAPWKDEYLRNIEKAIACYEAGYYYWKEAQLWAEKANTKKFNFLFITDLQNWEDERERIKTGELNYKQILDRELTRLKKVRDEFIAMDSKNY